MGGAGSSATIESSERNGALPKRARKRLLSRGQLTLATYSQRANGAKKEGPVSQAPEVVCPDQCQDGGLTSSSNQFAAMFREKMLKSGSSGIHDHWRQFHRFVACQQIIHIFDTIAHLKLGFPCTILAFDQ